MAIIQRSQEPRLRMTGGADARSEIALVCAACLLASLLVAMLAAPSALVVHVLAIFAAVLAGAAKIAAWRAPSAEGKADFLTAAGLFAFAAAAAAIFSDPGALVHYLGV